MPRTTDSPQLVWFRDDLRTADHPALTAALSAGPTIAVYIFDEQSPGLRALGGAARWWLHHALLDLHESLSQLGVPLILLDAALWRSRTGSRHPGQAAAAGRGARSAQLCRRIAARAVAAANPRGQFLQGLHPFLQQAARPRAAPGLAGPRSAGYRALQLGQRGPGKLAPVAHLAGLVRWFGAAVDARRNRSAGTAPRGGGIHRRRLPGASRPAGSGRNQRLVPCPALGAPESPSGLGSPGPACGFIPGRVRGCRRGTTPAGLAGFLLAPAVPPSFSAHQEPARRIRWVRLVVAGARSANRGACSRVATRRNRFGRPDGCTTACAW